MKDRFHSPRRVLSRLVRHPYWVKLFQWTCLSLPLPHPVPSLFFSSLRREELIIKFNGITCSTEAVIHLDNRSGKRFIERNCFLKLYPREQENIFVFIKIILSPAGRNCFFQDPGQLSRRQESFDWDPAIWDCMPILLHLGCPARFFACHNSLSPTNS